MNDYHGESRVEGSTEKFTLKDNVGLRTMTLDELNISLAKFRQRVQNFRDLLHQSRNDAIPRIVRNHQQIAQMRSELNAEYGRLEKFIRKFGRNPQMADPVNRIPYAVYGNAFADDILQRVMPSLGAVLQDLDYIVGKLCGMTEDDFRQALEPPKPKEGKSSKEHPVINGWQITNPFWLLWRLIKFIWRHKIISILITLLSLLAIDWSLAWHNVNSVKDFFSRVLRQ